MLSFAQCFDLFGLHFDLVDEVPDTLVGDGETTRRWDLDRLGPVTFNGFYDPQNEDRVFARLYSVRHGDFAWYRVTLLAPSPPEKAAGSSTPQTT